MSLVEVSEPQSLAEMHARHQARRAKFWPQDGLIAQKDARILVLEGELKDAHRQKAAAEDRLARVQAAEANLVEFATPEVEALNALTQALGEDDLAALRVQLRRAINDCQNKRPSSGDVTCPAIRLRRANIIDVVATYSEFDKVDLCSHRRTAGVVYWRQIAMYLMREHTLSSLPEIGRFLGGRDHTTILHGCRKIAALLARNDERTVKAISDLRAVLGVG